MIDSYEYSEDGKFLVFTTRRSAAISVPVEVLDFLNSVYISNHKLDELRAFRRNTGFDAEGQISSVPQELEVGQLEGVDLTGKTVRLYYANWEDSEWLETSSASTVVNTGVDNYRLVFPQEDVYNNPDNYSEEEYNAIPYDVDRLIGMSLYGKEKIWVSVTK